MTVVAYNDWRCGDELDPFGRDAAPLEVLAQDIYHFLITNKNTLILDPDWGFGLEQYLGQPLPSTLAADIENGVRTTFDGYVDDAECKIERIPGEEESYRLDLKCAVGDEFLTLALVLTPSGIVRVAE